MIEGIERAIDRLVIAIEDQTNVLRNLLATVDELVEAPRRVREKWPAGQPIPCGCGQPECAKKREKAEPESRQFDGRLFWCPKCGVITPHRHTGNILTSMPPQTETACVRCGTRQRY